MIKNNKTQIYRYDQSISMYLLYVQAVICIAFIIIMYLYRIAWCDLPLFAYFFTYVYFQLYCFGDFRSQHWLIDSITDCSSHPIKGWLVERDPLNLFTFEFRDLLSPRLHIGDTKLVNWTFVSFLSFFFYTYMSKKCFALIFFYQFSHTRGSELWNANPLTEQ